MVNPKQLYRKAKQYLQSPNRNKENEALIRKKADIYRQLIADERYKPVLKELFEQKIAEAKEKILAIKVDNMDLAIIQYIELCRDIKIYTQILTAPDNWIKTNEELLYVEKVEEELKAKGLLK